MLLWTSDYCFVFFFFIFVVIVGDKLISVFFSLLIHYVHRVNKTSNAIFVHNSTINKTRNDYITCMMFTLYHGSLRKRYRIANFIDCLHCSLLIYNCL